MSNIELVGFILKSGAKGTWIIKVETREDYHALRMFLKGNFVAFEVESDDGFRHEFKIHT